MKLVRFFSYSLYLDHRSIELDTNAREGIIGIGFLPASKLIFCPTPTLEQTSDEEDTVWGMLYKVTEKKADDLGVALGCPTLYEPSRHRIYTIYGPYNNCISYVANQEALLTGSRKPDTSYLEIMRIAARKLKLPEPYQKFLDDTIKLGV